MVKAQLLDVLAADTDEVTKDLLFPVQPTQEEPTPARRAAKSYTGAVPDVRSDVRKAPYICHQVVTSADIHQPGSRPRSYATVRSVFCVWSEDPQEGQMMLLNLFERVRVSWLKRQVLDKRFQLQLGEEQQLEYLIYPDIETTLPYHKGEMKSVWSVPAVEREVPWE